MRGKFIVIDGTDGSGKTDQVELLVARLKQAGQAVEFISFPRYETPSGKVVRAYLDGQLGSIQEVGAKPASILYAVDRYAAKPLIEKWLAEGRIVVANRYVAANMGHQGGKISDPTQRQEFLDWNDELEYEIFKIPRPNLNIILHLPAENGQRRAEKRDGGMTDIHQQDLQHLKNAEATYLEIARSYPGFVLVSCMNGERELKRPEVHELVCAEVSKIL